MALRGLHERLLQTLCFELGGLCIAAPIYAVVFDTAASESLVLIGAMSLAVMVWLPVYNTLFDLADLRLSGRMASERPHALRLVHAILHEATAMLLTVPLILWLSDHGLLTAIGLDLGLTLLYAVYAYLFHLIYDRLRPVQAS